MSSDNSAEFSCYEKMPNNTKKFQLPKAWLKGAKGPAPKVGVDYLQALHSEAHAKSWVVTEKVHGANFAFVTDGTKVRAGRRNAFLEENESFFGHKHVYARHESKVLELFESLKKLHKAIHPRPLSYSHIQPKDHRGLPVHEEEESKEPAETKEGKESKEGEDEIVRIHIYGELFGGGYNHADVPKTNNVGEKLVQTEIFYCPQLEFYAFDIAFETKHHPEKAYMDYDLAVRLFDEHKFFFAKPLFLGALCDAIGYDVNFPTTIPKLLGLPPIPNNNSEGVVIKPVRTLVGGMDMERVILKNKADAFLEKALAPKAKPEEKAKQGSTGILGEIELFITKNRYNNLISKVGPSAKKDDSLVEMFVKDVLDDVMEEVSEPATSKNKKGGKKEMKIGDKWKVLPEPGKAKLRLALTAKVAEFISQQA